MPPHVWHSISRLRAVDILELVPLDVGVGFLALGTLETGFVQDEERSSGRLLDGVYGAGLEG